ncbi:MAG: hypothetical protein U0871_05710 [Gemmataceae bacterium]
MADPAAELQRRTCQAFGAGFDPPAPGTKVGIALRTLDRIPVHGVRLAPTETTCGWYIYAGDEWSDAPDFYQPLCVEHVADCCPAAVPFLGLPPGWHFLTDGNGFADAWRDG